MSRINLLDYDRQGLQSFFQTLNEPVFRADQMIQWIHQYGITDFNEMTNLSKSLREKLIETAEVKAPDIALEKISADGVKKWLLKLADGNAIETVFIPQGDRGTLCVSSQVGCALNCSFCSTGKQGFSRNLTLAEIIGQLWIAVRRLSKQKGRHDRQITNVVMMGMGEPLLNFDPVVQAMNLMLNDLAYGLSKYRVTLSTSGIIPEMKRLREVSPVSLAVSLHAPNDELRNELVPVNKKYPLQELIKTCRDYFPKESKREILFEYVMLKNINDSDHHAKMLIKLLQNIRAKINLIPFNPFPQTFYETSTPERIARFQDILMKGGIQTTKRTTRGDEVDAACGQLVGQVFEKTQRKKQWAKILVTREEKEVYRE